MNWVAYFTMCPWKHTEKYGYSVMGLSTHYALEVRRYLNSQYENRWIGREGTTQWPPKSPDLTPLNFLWGYFKELVYANENQTEQELRQKIREGINVIKNNERTFRLIKRNFIRRCRLCVRANGRNFEQLM